MTSRDQILTVPLWLSVIALNTCLQGTAANPSLERMAAKRGHHSALRRLEVLARPGVRPRRQRNGIRGSEAERSRRLSVHEIQLSRQAALG